MDATQERMMDATQERPRHARASWIQQLAKRLLGGSTRKRRTNRGAHPNLEVLEQHVMLSHGCPSGWVCLFQDANFQGRMLKFRQVTSTAQSLIEYNFNDKASSWVNNSNHGAKLYKGWNGHDGSGPTITLHRHANSSSMTRGLFGLGDGMTKRQQSRSFADEAIERTIPQDSDEINGYGYWWVNRSTASSAGPGRTSR